MSLCKFRSETEDVHVKSGLGEQMCVKFVDLNASLTLGPDNAMSR